MDTSSFPVPLAVLKRIVDAAGDPDTTTRQISDLLGHDAALSADMLRVANSAFFGFPGTVSTVERAVTLLGLHRVRNLVLCRAVTGLVPARKVKAFPLTVFWQASLRRGAASLALARRTGRNPEAADSCFTVGLCQDLGVLVSMLSNDRLAHRYATIMALPAPARLYLERELVEGHNEVTAAMFEEWGLPDDIVLPIRHHHWPEGAPEHVRVLARVANAAETFADLFVASDKGAALQLVRDGLTLVGLEVGLVEELVGEINDEVHAASQAFGLTAPAQPSFEEIAEAASTAIASLQSTAEKTAHDLQAALLDKLRLVDELNQANARLSVEALTDPLTKLPNRRAFATSLEQAVAQALRQSASLVVLMLDIDFFKRVNDEYGHPAGDVILRNVAVAAQRSLRKADLVARVGGEEFAVLLPFTSVEDGRMVAERLRTSVAALESVWEGQGIRVTASIGGASGVSEPKELIARADKALYAAKEAGRDRVVWEDEL